MRVYVERELFNNHSPKDRSEQSRSVGTKLRKHTAQGSFFELLAVIL